MNAFLGYAFTEYGTKAFKLINQLPNERDDVLSMVYFPKVAKCEFKYFVSGGPTVFHSLCVLPVNIFNEKIYVFLW